LATLTRAETPMDEPPSTVQRKHQYNQLRVRLKSIEQEIIQLTDREPPLPTKINFFKKGSLDSPQFCGHWKRNQLQISHQLIGRPLLLDTVLYREMYSAILPNVVRSVPESGDLGILCAYLHFDDSQREQLLRVWQAVSPRRHYGDITYNAPLSLPLFNRVTQNSFLKLVLSYLDDLEPAPSPLTSREYVELIETFMLNYTSPLTEQELKALHLLQENTNAKIQDLAKRSSFSIGCLSKHIAAFKEKLLLTRFYRVDFPLIRLNHIAVLAYPSPGSRFNRYLEQCPYLRKVHRFGGSSAPYLITYVLPRLRLRRLREWLQELVGLGHLTRFRLYPLDGVFQGYNLRSYLAHDSEIPMAERFRWVAWVRYLRDVLIREGFGKVLEQPYVYQYSEPHIEPAQLDAIDYQLLAHITPESTAEEMAKLLSVSSRKIRNRQHKLFEKKVLFERPDLGMYHLGLNESLFVMLEGSEEVVQNFLAGCKEAPMYGGSTFSHPTPGCIVAFGLPTGLALKVGRELSRLFLEQEDFDAAVFYGNGSKDFTVASVLKRCRFDIEKNQWVWHREYLPTSFEYVATHQLESSPQEEDDQWSQS
jgi:hypothetical protein